MASADDLIQDARSYTSDAVANAIGAINSAITNATQDVLINEPEVDVDPVVLPEGYIDLDDLPGFSQTFNMPGGEPTMGGLSTLYIPTVPNFANPPAALNTSGLFQHVTPTLNIPEFTAPVPDITTEWDMPPDLVLSLPDTPSIGAVTIGDLALNIPTPGDVDDFVGTYAPPTNLPGVMSLTTAVIPGLPSFPNDPPEFDDSGLWQTAKPTFSPPTFNVADITVNTNLTVPDPPTITVPDGHEGVAVVVPTASVTVPTLTDAPTTSVEYTAPGSTPSAMVLTTPPTPSVPDFGTAPSDLNTTGLFDDLKPDFDLPAFDVPDPGVTTSFTMPTAPTISLPTEPTITPVDVGTIDIEMPPITDPEAFSGAYEPPTTSPGDLTLNTVTLPDAPSVPTAPGDLDTSDLFKDPKPVFNLPDFSVPSPDVDTTVTMPPTPDITYPDAPTVTDVTLGDVALTMPSVTDPSAFTDEFTLPSSAPSAPDFVTPTLPDLPTFGEPPDPLDTTNLFKIPAPTWAAPEFTAVEPTIDTDFDLPTKPTIDFPAEPALPDVTVGDAPTVTLPTFDATFDATEPAPVDLAAEFKSEYLENRPLLMSFVATQLDQWMTQYAVNHSATAQQALANKISEGLAGGNALPETFETNLYARARAKIDAEQAAASAQTMAQLTKRGFVYPPGAMTAAVNGLLRDYANRLAQFAQEVAVERAKQEIQHVQFVVQVSSQLQQAAQQAAIGYAQSLVGINGQALEYAKMFAQNLAEMYNASLELYKAKISLFQTQAQVYETRLKAALAVWDGYRLELEAAKLRKDLNVLDVQMYEARLNAQVKKIEVYSTEVNAVKILADLERLKIDVFRGQVEAYSNRVQAEASKFQAYKAAIDGDTAKVQGYLAQVQGYTAEIEAEGKKADVGIARAKTTIDMNASLVQRYQAGVDKYRADVQAEQGRFSSSVEAYRASLQWYEAAIKAKIERINAELSQARINLETAKTRKDVDQIDVQIYSTRVQALMTKVQVYEAQLRGVTTQLEAEKLKVDVYSAQVQAFMNRAKAESEKFGAYRAAVDGDLAVVQGYKAQVDAYSAKADATAKIASIGNDRARLTIEDNRSKTEAYSASIDRYRADVQSAQIKITSLIDIYRAKLDGYKTALDAKLQKLRAQIDQARINLDVAKTKQEIDRLDIEMYEALLDAQEKRVQIYVHQLEGVKVLASLEELKINVYDSRVKAYLTRAQAEEAKFGAYKAAIDGDLAVVQGYTAQMDGYKTKVEAIGKRSDVEIERAKLVIATNQAEVERYRAEVDKYRADMDGEKARTGVLLESYRVSLDSYRATVETRIRQLEGNISIAKLHLEEAKTAKDVDLIDSQIVVAEADVALKRLEVYLGQLKAVQTRADLEKLKVEVYTAQVQAYSTRVDAEKGKFEAFKVATEADTAQVQGYTAVVDAYKAQVQAAGTKVEAEASRSRAINESNQILIDKYKAELGTYEASIRNAQAQFSSDLEGYKAALGAYELALTSKLKVLDEEIKEAEANISIAQLKKDVDLAEVQSYAAQVDGLRAKVQLYSAQLDAVKTLASTENLKVDLYTAQVQGFLGRVQAEKAKFDAYEAAVKGDVAVVQGYQAQVAAYTANVEAEAKKADVDMEHGRLVLESNKGVLGQYQSELDAYKTRIGAEVSRFGGYAEAYRVQIAAYTAELEAKAKALEVAVMAKGSEVDVAKLKANVELETRLKIADLTQQGLLKAADAAVQAGSIHGQVAASALAGMNSLAVTETQITQD